MKAFFEWFQAKMSDLMDTEWFMGCFLFVIIAGIVLFCIAIVLMVVFGSKAEPSLFCANGTQVHASPATVIVGKVPVEGVEYTCR
jgi:hypothetical protein